VREIRTRGPMSFSFAVYAERRTMPNGRGFNTNKCLPSLPKFGFPSQCRSA
jgi:hypothetical protein